MINRPKAQQFFEVVAILVASLLFFRCGDDDKVQIFLCLGQSNMAGRAAILPGDIVTNNNILLFNDSDAWELARNPLNRYSTVRKRLSMQRLGPSWSFATTLSGQFPEMKIGLVVNALGGSSIDQWKKGSHLYNEAIIKALKAQKTGTLRAILWHQGESDKDAWKTYTSKFDSLAFYLRKDLAIPDLPIMVGEVGKWNASNREINKVLVSLPQYVPAVQVVSSNGLVHLGDHAHFDAPSQKELGKRYAEKVIQYIYGK